MSDHERPLDRTGVAQAEGIAGRLAGLGVAPDLLVTSPARRTRQTTDALARAMRIPASRIRDEAGLYLAPADDILELIRAVEPEVLHLMIVGHNPGLSDLASWLTGPGRIAGSLDTGAACILTFEVEDWSAVGPDTAARVHGELPPP